MSVVSWVKGRLFKDEYALLEVKKRECFDLREKNEELTKRCDALMGIVKDCCSKDVHLIGEAQNSDGEKFFVVKKTKNNSMDIYLYGGQVYTHRQPRLYGSIKTNKAGEKYVYIDDCFAEVEGKGNGTLLIKWLLNEARKIGATYVSGELSSVDKGKFEYLRAFYTKNGFQVTIEGDEGRIYQKI